MLGRDHGTRWIYPNSYGGWCHRCDCWVAAGTGQVRFDGTRWVTRQLGGACHTPEYTSYVTDHSEAWDRVRQARLLYAGNRCEWRTLFSARCRVVAPLQCHHRHYLTLGNERLKDVIILCREHHALADGRRRLFGRYPIIGRPINGTWLATSLEFPNASGSAVPARGAVVPTFDPVASHAGVGGADPGERALESTRTRLDSK